MTGLLSIMKMICVYLQYDKVLGGKKLTTPKFGCGLDDFDGFSKYLLPEEKFSTRSSSSDAGSDLIRIMEM
jgi:hypothetical protein